MLKTVQLDDEYARSAGPYVHFIIKVQYALFS